MFAYLLLVALLLLYIATLYNYRAAIALFNFLAHRDIHNVQDIQGLFDYVDELQQQGNGPAPSVPPRNPARLSRAVPASSNSPARNDGGSVDENNGSGSGSGNVSPGGVGNGVEESEPPSFPPDWWKCTSHGVRGCKAEGCRMEAERRGGEQEGERVVFGVRNANRRRGKMGREFGLA
jgi:hypothetical protein